MSSKPRQRLTRDQIARMVAMANASGDRAGVAAGFGVSKTTVDKYVRAVADEPWLYRATNRRPDRTWMLDAACRGMRDDDDQYFTEWPVYRQIAVCRTGCPVRLQCLEYGLAGPIDVNRKSSEGSVFGGVPPKRLAEMQRRRSVTS